MSDLVNVRNGTFVLKINTIIQKCEAHVFSCEVGSAICVTFFPVYHTNYILFGSTVNNFSDTYIFHILHIIFLYNSCVRHTVSSANIVQTKK